MVIGVVVGILTILTFALDAPHKIIKLFKSMKSIEVNEGKVTPPKPSHSRPNDTPKKPAHEVPHTKHVNEGKVPPPKPSPSRNYVTPEKTAHEVLKRICSADTYSDQDTIFESFFQGRWMKLNGKLARDPRRLGDTWHCEMWENHTYEVGETRSTVLVETSDDLSYVRSNDRVEVEGRVAEFIRDREGRSGPFTGIVRISLGDAIVTAPDRSTN